MHIKGIKLILTFKRASQYNVAEDNRLLLFLNLFFKTAILRAKEKKIIVFDE